MAFIVGGAFVWLVMALGHHGIATPIPFYLLFLGIMAGAFVPDSGFNPEGDVHPWGPISTFIAYAINILIYSGLIYFLLGFIRRLVKASR